MSNYNLDLIERQSSAPLSLEFAEYLHSVAPAMIADLRDRVIVAEFYGEDAVEAAENYIEWKGSE
jgi:hypothetical protein